MEERREFTCICCPLGCQILAQKNGEDWLVTGNNCPKGEKYVRDEMTNPTRMVTSMVKVLGGEMAVVSVKTKEAIPKDKIWECMEILKTVTVKAPVNIGDTVVKNVAETGIDIVATKNVDRG